MIRLTSSSLGHSGNLRPSRSSRGMSGIEFEDPELERSAKQRSNEVDARSHLQPSLLESTCESPHLFRTDRVEGSRSNSVEKTLPKEILVPLPRSGSVLRHVQAFEIARHE